MRTAAGVATAVIGGVLVAYVDSRPGWDDTGVTVVALIVVAGIAGFVVGRRPWIVALLVGAPTPVIEIAQQGQTASLVALAFAAFGAAIGWGLSRLATPEPRPSG
jgi:hypothetical protein